MSKKKNKDFKVDKDKVQRSFWYRFSKKIVKVPTVILIIISILIGIGDGAIGRWNADIYAHISDMDPNMFIDKLIQVCIMMTVSHHAICTFAKAARLDIINENYLKLFERALKSKVADIAEIGPERILSATESIAVLRASIHSNVIDIVKAIIPFMVVILKLWQMNKIAAVIVTVVMAICISLQLNGNNIFHFDTVKGAMKADMRGISTNQFMVIRMLKYMHAEKWAWERLNTAQWKAAPSLHNSLSQLFSGIIYGITMIPEIIVMYNSLVVRYDPVTAVYLGFNMGSVYSMIYILIGMGETKSELDGELDTINKLKADDGYSESSGEFTREMLSFPTAGVNLMDEWFYYASDTEHKKPFIIEDFPIIDGKWYRIDASSGAGKSTLFRFFAGEMQSQWKPDFEIFYIHQEAQLVKYESIYKNIVLGNDNVPRDDVMALLEDARLGNWVRSLPNGIDTVIGTEVNPSGGEASRLSLLRLFVYLRNYDEKGRYDRGNKRHPLILLDEVTSAVDKDANDGELSTEEAIIKLVERECQGCTMMVISHEIKASPTYGFRNIVDFTCKMDIRNENGLEKHILHAPVATGNNKNCMRIDMLTTNQENNRAVK